MTASTTPSIVAGKLTEARELVSRCERARGADRELDAKIARAVGRIPKSAAYEGTIKMGDLAWSNGLGYQVPAYTGSLDAAMTLVPGKCGVNIMRPSYNADLEALTGGMPSGAQVFDHDESIDVTMACATPALALCAASLRALLHKEEGCG
jgi:hypothetical protein